MTDDDLAALAGAQRERRLLLARKAGLATAVARAAGQWRSRHAAFLAAQRRARSLSRLSPARVLRTVLGDRSQAFRDADAAVRSARLAVVQARKRHAELDEQLGEVSARLRATDGAVPAYTAALARAEDRLREAGGEVGERLIELTEVRGRENERLRVLLGAVEAVRNAAAALARAEDMLGSADGWSIVDTFLAGGVLAGWRKTEALDEAADQVAQGGCCLEAARTILADLGISLPAAIRLPVDGLTRVLDLCVDNPLVDFWVHERIRASQEELEMLAGQVSALRMWLVGQAGVTCGRLHEIEGERTALLCA